MKPSRVDALILLSAPSAATEGAFFLTECSTLLFFDTHGIHCKATMTPPIDRTAIYDKSLYEAEESANKFETELIQAITGLPNIRWWHRNIARTGFAINGFINHYPDFIVRTRSGKIVIIETKGDHLANEETLAKLHLGRAWQAQAGPGYRYFLVFQDKDISMTGEYPMSEFLKIPAEL